MKNTKLINDAQLRLLLPKEWIAELDTIASIRFTTRLALIRHYLRKHLDQDLIRLDDNIQAREKIRKSKLHVDTWLQSNHQEPDEW
jgi:hypothetical protein